MPDLSYREFTIKKRNGKHRRICAPSKDLLAYQREQLPRLGASFQLREYATFGKEIFHGFVPGRNCVTAANQHIGYAHTIGLDISNCFDSIKYITIPEVDLSAISYYAHRDGTLAQGFATSPMFANIYLLEPIKQLIDFLDVFMPQQHSVTVYADDIQISIKHPTSYYNLNTIIDMTTAIFSTFDLTINKKKTRIHHAKFGNRRILGIQVGDSTLNPNRRLRKKIRAARHQHNGPSLGGLVTASRLLLPKSRR